VGAWLWPQDPKFKRTDSLAKTPDDRVRLPLPSEQRESPRATRLVLATPSRNPQLQSRSQVAAHMGVERFSTG